MEPAASLAVPSDRPRPPWAWIALALAVPVAVAAILLLRQHAIVARNVADARAWAVGGPPCPGLTRAAFLAPGQKGARKFEFEGVQFFRRYGPVSCASILDHGGLGERAFVVCRFSRPADLMVRTAAGDWFFRPGPGRPAAISTASGTPVCVMDGGAGLRR